MTELEFWTAEKRALERLNPKMLCSGPVVYGTNADSTVCAMGALLVALAHKGRVENLHAARYEMNSLGWSDLDADELPYELSDHSEAFRPHDNSPHAQRARWKHVYAFVGKKVATFTEAVA